MLPDELRELDVASYDCDLVGGLVGEVECVLVGATEEEDSRTAFHPVHSTSAARVKKTT
jgi:hypothetical protein